MLTMENNNISVIPSHALERLTMFRVVVLNSNFITSLGTGVFKNLGNLQIIRLSNNWISNISDHSLIDLQNLISLELQHNTKARFISKFDKYDFSKPFAKLHSNC